MLVYKKNKGYFYNNYYTDEIIPVDNMITFNSPKQLIAIDNGDYSCAFIIETHKIHIYYQYVYSVEKWMSYEFPEDYKIQEYFVYHMTSITCCYLKNNILETYTLDIGRDHNIKLVTGLSIMNVKKYKIINDTIIIIYEDNEMNYVRLKDDRLAVIRTCGCDKELEPSCDCELDYSIVCKCEDNCECNIRLIDTYWYEFEKIELPKEIIFDDIVYLDKYLNCVSVRNNNIIIRYREKEYIFENIYKGGKITRCTLEYSIIFSYLYENVTHILYFKINKNKIVELKKIYQDINTILPYECTQNRWYISEENYAEYNKEDNHITITLLDRNKFVNIAKYKYDFEVCLSYSGTIIKKWDCQIYNFLSKQQKNQILLLLLYNKNYFNGIYRIPKYLLHIVFNYLLCI